MNISKHNYEAFLLDYLEGRLSRSETAVLKAFVIQHPELGSWNELTAELPLLPLEHFSFPNKNMLLQQPAHPNAEIRPDNAEHFFIAWHEGLLNEQQKQELMAFLDANPQLHKDFDLYGATYNKPDPALVMPDKASLKRSVTILRIAFIRNMSVAASLLLLLSLGWWWLRPDATTTKVVVDEPFAAVSIDIEITSPTETPANYTLSPTLVSDNTQLLSMPKRAEIFQREEASLLPAMAMKSLPTVNQTNNISSVQAPEASANDRLLLARLIESKSPAAVNRPAALRVLDNTLNKAMDITGLSSFRNDSRTELTKQSGLSALATAGIQAYNSLTDKEVNLEKVPDDQGGQQVRLRSEKVLINRYTGGN